MLYYQNVFFFIAVYLLRQCIQSCSFKRPMYLFPIDIPYSTLQAHGLKSIFAKILLITIKTRICKCDFVSTGVGKRGARLLEHVRLKVEYGSYLILPIIGHLTRGLFQCIIFQLAIVTYSVVLAFSNFVGPFVKVATDNKVATLNP